MKIKLMLLLLFFLLCCFETKAKASKIRCSSEIDYQRIQQTIDEMSIGNEAFQFESYVSKLVRGEQGFSLKGILGEIGGGIQSEIKGKLSTIGVFLAITIAAAVFTNFSLAFRNGQTAETGFFVTYLLLYSLLATTFFASGALVSSALHKVLEFMKVLVPAYAMSIAFSTGAASSVIFYQGILFIITLVDILLIKIILPLIHLYMLVMLANNISHGEMLSKAGDLLEFVIRWSLKTVIAIVIGFGTIQGLIVPAVDRVKRSAVVKMASAIPGVGNILSGVTETVIGTGVLMKNAIGVAGMVVIVILCAVPLVKLVLYVLTYKVSCAVVQPISDKRMMQALSSAADASMLLLHTLFAGIVVFLIAITIVAVSARGIA